MRNLYHHTVAQLFRLWGIQIVVLRISDIRNVRNENADVKKKIQKIFFISKLPGPHVEVCDFMDRPLRFFFIVHASVNIGCWIRTEPASHIAAVDAF
ncbi:MAG: hypothetical protein C0600_09665 [Ignavibacteria bacterium]|nr:MAG: hypothetical protein C0600_09665 [Ignavibacteria bacterium]